MTYSAEQIVQMTEALDKWVERGDDLSSQLSQYAATHSEAKEIIVHGFLRRQFLLEHLLSRVFEVIPPDCVDASRSSLLDVTAFIQAFLLNVYGAIDNFAYFWNISVNPNDSKGKPFARSAIGLRPSNVAFKATLPNETQEYLRGMTGWFKYLENFRHALAHRIPLYIPPYTLNTEATNKAMDLKSKYDQQPYVPGALSSYYAQLNKLGKFTPIIQHSYIESLGTVYFHSQMVCDYATVIELGEKILDAVQTTNH